MSTTTDFDEWLDEGSLFDHEDVYALLQTVEERGDFEPFTLEELGDERMLIKRSGSTQHLLLASDNARRAFFQHVTERYGVDHFPDAESYVGFHRAMDDDRK